MLITNVVQPGGSSRKSKLGKHLFWGCQWQNQRNKNLFLIWFIKQRHPHWRRAVVAINITHSHAAGPAQVELKVAVDSGKVGWIVQLSVDIPECARKLLGIRVVRSQQNHSRPELCFARAKGCQPEGEPKKKKMPLDPSEI